MTKKLFEELAKQAGEIKKLIANQVSNTSKAIFNDDNLLHPTKNIFNCIIASLDTFSEISEENFTEFSIEQTLIFYIEIRSILLKSTLALDRYRDSINLSQLNNQKNELLLKLEERITTICHKNADAIIDYIENKISACSADQRKQEAKKMFYYYHLYLKTAFTNNDERNEPIVKLTILMAPLIDILCNDGKAYYTKYNAPLYEYHFPQFISNWVYASSLAIKALQANILQLLASLPSLNNANKEILCEQLSLVVRLYFFIYDKYNNEMQNVDLSGCTRSIESLLNAFNEANNTLPESARLFPTLHKITVEDHQEAKEVPAFNFCNWQLIDCELNDMDLTRIVWVNAQLVNCKLYSELNLDEFAMAKDIEARFDSDRLTKHEQTLLEEISKNTKLRKTAQKNYSEHLSEKARKQQSEALKSCLSYKKHSLGFLADSCGDKKMKGKMLKQSAIIYAQN